MPIEQHGPGLERLVDVQQEIEELARGFGGVTGPAEGPVWWQEGGYLVFSDIGNNRRMKWTPGAARAFCKSCATRPGSRPTSAAARSASDWRGISCST